MADERWPLLTNMMACYFNEDFERLYGSVGGALAAAAADGSTDHRRSIADEWWDWNSSQGAAADIRPFLDNGFGVAAPFDTPLEARTFMNRVYDALIVGVRAESRGLRDR